MKNHTFKDVPQIERTAKLITDKGDELFQTRKQIYEVEKNKIYVLIVKKLGEPCKIVTAQNELCFYLMGHMNNRLSLSQGKAKIKELYLDYTQHFKSKLMFANYYKISEEKLDKIIRIAQSFNQ